jgi:ABC-type glycerol-3-phosphate transport system substrate-binding protein
MVKISNTTEGDERVAGVSRRRFLAATGATGITLGVAGCSGGGGGGTDIDPDADIEEEVTVELAMDQDFADVQSGIQDALYEAGLDENISIEILPGDFETGSRQTSFTQALDSGRSSPDVFMMDSGWTIPFIVREQVVNLEQALTQDTLDYVKNNYLESTVNTASNPNTGDLYGVPVFPDYPTVQYRQDLVEEAGYSPAENNWSTEPMSWQEFGETVADVWEYHGRDSYDYGFTTQAANYAGLSCCTFNETMTSFGGAYFGDHENLFGPVGERPVTVNEQPVIDTIRVMRSFMYGSDAENAHPDYPQISTSDLVEFTEEPSRQPFTNGNALFHRNWPYSIAINAEEYGDAMGTMPLPYGVPEGEGNYEGTGGTAAALGGWHLTLNPNSDNLNASAQTIGAFANENVMLALFELGGWLPPVSSVTEQATVDQVGRIANHLDTLRVAGESTVPRPVTPVWTDQSPLINSEVHATYTGSKRPSNAMETLQADLEATEEI